MDAVRRSVGPTIGHDPAAFADFIFGAEGPLALVIRAGSSPPETTFVTEPTADLQVGFIVYGADGRVARHMHRPPSRRVDHTTEALLIRSGRCVAEIYDEDATPVREVELCAGDVLVLFAGGHGFRMLGDTVMLEIKQGPYAGAAEKQPF